VDATGKSLSSDAATRGGRLRTSWHVYNREHSGDREDDSTECSTPSSVGHTPVIAPGQGVNDNDG
jgi:hypothetical protein